MKHELETEKESAKIKRNRRLVIVILAVAIAAVTAVSRGLFSQTDAKGVLHLLSDGFLVPGALFAGIGGLSWVSTTGFFDIFGYGCSHVFGRFIPFDSVYRRKEKYYDYKVRKDEKGRNWNKELLLTGACALALAVLCTVLYEVM